MKKADENFEVLLGFHMLFEATDCRGETRTRKPVI